MLWARSAISAGTPASVRTSWNTDFAILKDTKVAKISETFNVQFRAELFNIFNHTNRDHHVIAAHSAGAEDPPSLRLPQ
jgi:hypothetical protein